MSVSWPVVVEEEPPDPIRPGGAHEHRAIGADVDRVAVGSQLERLDLRSRREIDHGHRLHARAVAHEQEALVRREVGVFTWFEIGIGLTRPRALEGRSSGR